jgi:hypothetical protein
MYQLLQDTSTGAATCIKRIADNAFIPFDPANSAYAEYLAWLDEGNTPLPADPPPPPDPKMVGIEFESVMCSATRDDQNGLVAVIIAHQLQKTSFQPTEFKFVNGNRLLMTYENLPKFLAVWIPFRQSFFKPE